MRRLPTVLLIGGLATVTAGCLTLMPVGSHFERGHRIHALSDLRVGTRRCAAVSDQRLRDNPFFVDDVHGAIDSELQDRGLRHATSEPADLLVHYHAAVTGRVEVPVDGRTASRLRRRGVPDRVAEYEAGTLVIDVVDARTQRVVWRGWAEHRLEDMLDDPPAVHRRVQDAVHRIMKTLPVTERGVQVSRSPDIRLGDG